jgi:lysophospholipase L1-like esterase
MFVYTALGDSITAGQSASSVAFAYPNLIISNLKQTQPRLYVLARSGWTSSVLMDAMINQEPEYLQRSNTISIWIGGDDLIKAGLAILNGSSPNIFQTTLFQYQSNLSSMVRELRTISNARIVICTQYNPFPNNPIAVNSINSLNQITRNVAKQSGATLADTYRLFEGRQSMLIKGYKTGRYEDALRGSPPIHPNNKGHAAIAGFLSPFISRGQ